MFLKCVLLGIFFAVILLVFDFIYKKIKLKYRLHKELKEKKKRQEAFKKRMEELEIK